MSTTRLKYFYALIFLFTLIFAYQNCSESSFIPPGSSDAGSNTQLDVETDYQSSCTSDEFLAGLDEENQPICLVIEEVTGDECGSGQVMVGLSEDPDSVSCVEALLNIDHRKCPLDSELTGRLDDGTYVCNSFDYLASVELCPTSQYAYGFDGASALSPLPLKCRDYEGGSGVQICQPDSIISCSVENGVAERACNAAGTDYSACTVRSCDNGYVQSGNTCTKEIFTINSVSCSRTNSNCVPACDGYIGNVSCTRGNSDDDGNTTYNCTGACIPAGQLDLSESVNCSRTNSYCSPQCSGEGVPEQAVCSQTSSDDDGNRTYRCTADCMKESDYVSKEAVSCNATNRDCTPVCAGEQKILGDVLCSQISSDDDGNRTYRCTGQCVTL